MPKCIKNFNWGLLVPAAFTAALIYGILETYATFRVAHGVIASLGAVILFAAVYLLVAFGILYGAMSYVAKNECDEMDQGRD